MTEVSWRHHRRRVVLHFLRTKRARTGAGQFVTVAQVDQTRSQRCAFFAGCGGYWTWTITRRASL
jgi:hypothetical protein